MKTAKKCYLLKLTARKPRREKQSFNIRDTYMWRPRMPRLRIEITNHRVCDDCWAQCTIRRIVLTRRTVAQTVSTCCYATVVAAISELSRWWVSSMTSVKQSGQQSPLVATTRCSYFQSRLAGCCCCCCGRCVAAMHCVPASAANRPRCTALNRHQYGLQYRDPESRNWRRLNPGISGLQKFVEIVFFHC